MADSQDVWGIEIGQAGLKAIQLRYAGGADQVLAMDYDYVPFPKILSQPDAIPAELIPEALETFLERKDVHGAKVAISVPGPTSLARFINLPPVETNKVAEIVKYEAKQQIPFDLDEVIWDYQKISGSVDEDSGYMLNAEVGLFAMKREQVFETLQPFLDKGLEIDLVQIAPLALHNFVCYDQMGVRVDDEPIDGEEYTIVLDMGTDNTTLLITNGVKIWIRNVPLGGNHFTRALTKDMKLTFSKAEHLKCNATRAPDPRAVFKALRPVFDDYVSEIQRSIGYFASVNREAKIVKVLGVGNGFKLAGLQKFLQQSLRDMEVERTETLQAAIGEKVLNASMFQDNILTFAVPYGLALQAMELTRVHTTLLPREIATARTIRKKKPWAVVAASLLLAGLAIDVLPRGCVDHSVRNPAVMAAAKGSDKVVGDFNQTKSNFDGQKSAFTGEISRQQTLLGGSDRRDLVPEVFRAINECLPRDVGNQKDAQGLTQRNRINITHIVHKRYGDLKTEWFDKVIGTSDGSGYMDDEERKAPPSGSGYVFTLIGEHFHKGATQDDQLQFYVQKTLLSNLRQDYMQQPGTSKQVEVRRLGISHATLVQLQRDIVNYDPTGRVRLTTAGGAAATSPMLGTARSTGKAARKDVKFIKVDKTTFRLEFVWKPTMVAGRKDKQAAADNQPGGGTTPPPGTPPPATPAAAAGAAGGPQTPGS
ncbi:MAG: pilus assembly protein PilM [Planctomycetaceae bacterium]|jgi:type IV pilus assembly protein PilM|nr:pilus assembly protein PilM [Planctomycetaceae bacterium]